MLRNSFTFQRQTKLSANSSIFNRPYDLPACHYAISSDAQLNCNDPQPGRRIFSPQTPQMPIGQQAQGGEKSTKVMV